MCKVIKERKVDYVVMGFRGLGIVSRVFVGSVSDYCFYYLSVFVLVVLFLDCFEYYGFVNLY